MSKNFQEYEPPKKRSQKTHSSKSFSKKLKLQTSLSLVLFASVLFLRYINPDSSVNTYIKNAFMYKPDTSEITKIIENIFPLYYQKGQNNEETTIIETL